MESTGPGRPVIARMHTTVTQASDALALFCARFETGLPGPSPAVQPPPRSWPGLRSPRVRTCFLVSPTGTGKTLAGFLAILDRLFREHLEGTLKDGLRCVYISPLRSLGYDIERNLSLPLEGIKRQLEASAGPVKVGVRTGDTPAHIRRKLRDRPPHLLITTPESLSLLLSQECWSEHWREVDHLIVDEVHSLVPTKRGADLAVSLERLAALARPRSLPHRALGDMPAARARGTLSGGADANLPGGGSPPARGRLASGGRGRVADRTR